MLCWSSHLPSRQAQLRALMRPGRESGRAESRPLAARSQEIQEQWGLYDGYNHNLARVLRFRRSSGRRMPLMKVSAPGLDFSSMKVRRACFGRLQRRTELAKQPPPSACH